VTASPVGPDLLQLSGLEKTQQQALHAKRHLADFIEEHHPRVGRFELAGLVAVGAGEAALDVAEELRFEERLRKSGTVHRCKRHRGSWTERMDAPCHDLLADPAFARDQHFGIRPCHPLDLFLERQDLGTVAY
jgi:hypothetical protein